MSSDFSILSDNDDLQISAESKNDQGWWLIDEIPESWVWIEFRALFNNATNSNKKLAQKLYSESGKFPVIDQGKDIIGGYSDDQSLIYEGKLPVIIFGDHSRCVKFIESAFIQGADGVKILQINNLAVPKFAYYSLLTINLPDKGYSRHYKFLSTSKFPLPPLNEQRRIVEKVEALMARSRKAKEALDAIPKLIEQFRQSVLAAAFRGDLTADWREQNPNIEPASALLERIRKERREKWEQTELEKMRAKGKKTPTDDWKQKYVEEESIDDTDLLKLYVLPENWCWTRLEDIAELELGKMLDRGKEHRGKQLPYLRNINIRWRRINLDDLLLMDFEEDELERFSIKEGDVLVCEGGEPGRSAVWEIGQTEIKYQKTIHRVRPFCNIPPYWFVYHLMLDAKNGDLNKYLSGTTIRHFTKVSFQKYLVRIAGTEEQNEIIRRIEKLFDFADSLETSCKESIVELDNLNQSILSKAFRGELVEQDPNDEPASVLLERIHKEREKEKAKVKQTGAKKLKK